MGSHRSIYTDAVAINAPAESRAKMNIFHSKKWMLIFGILLCLLSACSAPAKNVAPADAPIQPAISSQAMTLTIQDISVQVIFQKPAAGKLVLPVVILGPEGDRAWKPGEAVLKSGKEYFTTGDVYELRQLPSSDGGQMTTAYHLELHFDFPESYFSQDTVQLEIPYVISNSPEGEQIRIDGPWIFDIPVAQD